MANAKHDANRVPVLIGISAVDGSPIPLKVDSVTGRLLAKLVTEDSSVYSIKTVAKHDDNRVPVLVGERSDNNKPVPMTIGSTNGWRMAI